MHVIDLSLTLRHGEGRLGLGVDFATPYSFSDCGWQVDFGLTVESGPFYWGAVWTWLLADW